MANEKIGHFSESGARRIAKHVQRFGDKQPASNRRHRRRAQPTETGAISVAIFEQVGGSDGTATEAATWKYNIRKFDDPTEVLLAGVDPSFTPHRHDRHVGSVAPARTGLITYDGEGNLIIICAFEIENYSTC